MEDVKEKPLVFDGEPMSALLNGQLVKSEPNEVIKREAEELVGFTPTERMEVMQAIAITCEEQGLGYLRDWIKSARSHDFFRKEAFSMKEWNEWVEIKGFNGWFYGGFPLPRTMSKEDIEGLDALFWDQMRTMMRDGDTKVMDLYAKITGKTDRAPEEAETNTEIVEWLQVNAGSVGWKSVRKLK
tara:strand:+ start:517 stop:1071 length:555 start_codon:yes stop_codon:yes gene_type:complete